MTKQNFVFTSLLTNRVRPHELREVLNRWGLALRTSKENQEHLRQRIIHCRDKIMIGDTLAFNNLLDDLDDHIAFWDENPMTRRKKKEKAVKPIVVPRIKTEPVKVLSLRELQIEYIIWALHKNSCNLGHTAESLSISIRTVRNVIKGNFGSISLRDVRQSKFDFESLLDFQPTPAELDSLASDLQQ